MKKETYIRLMDWGREKEKRTKWIKWINEITTRIIYTVYPLLILLLLFRRDSKVLKLILVPGISFVLISIFRNIYNQERPYIAFNYPSVIRKNKSGKSMPSRHVFSATIIAVASFYICAPLCILLGICALMMCFGRVLAGVHYPKDVLVGFILGIGMGIIGFYWF